MGLFYLVVLYALVRAAASRRPGGWHAAAVVACALGMGAKQMMITAPVVALLYDRTLLAGSFREALRRRWGLYAGLAATWLVLAPSLVVAKAAYADREVTTPLAYALTQFGVIVHYLGLSVWPRGLSLDYDWPVTRTVGEVLPPALLVGALGALTVWALARRRAAGLAGAAFFLVLAPTSSIVPIPDVAFEHRMYLPLASVVAVAVCGACAAGSRVVGRLFRDAGRRRRVGAAAGAALVAAAAGALGYRTVLRNADYRSAVSIWEAAARVRPKSARVQSNLGLALCQAGRPDQAERELVRAIELDPRHAQAYNNRGSILLQWGRADEAVQDYTRAIDLRPNGADAYYNRAVARKVQGRIDEAVADCTRAVGLKPRLAEAYHLRAACHLARKAYDEAWADVRALRSLGAVPAPELLKDLSAGSGRSE